MFEVIIVLMPPAVGLCSYPLRPVSRAFYEYYMDRVMIICRMDA